MTTPAEKIQKYNIGDIVLIPRGSQYNPRYDRDIRGKVVNVKYGIRTNSHSYLVIVGKKRTWFLESFLRPVTANALYVKPFTH